MAETETISANALLIIIRKTLIFEFRAGDVLSSNILSRSGSD